VGEDLHTRVVVLWGEDWRKGPRRNKSVGDVVGGWGRGRGRRSSMCRGCLEGVMEEDRVRVMWGGRGWERIVDEDTVVVMG